jgi:2-polyprenyl-3-methyl-5-hydroxy-6-metoxy-1,4-benzoquinol methylase
MTSREERKQDEAERRRESPTEYILATGEAAASRLEMLEDIFGPHSRQLLGKAGLCKGLRVADIGCGTGLVSLWIATQVGAEGRVVGVDMSCEQSEGSASECRRGWADECLLPRRECI